MIRLLEKRVFTGQAVVLSPPTLKGGTVVPIMSTTSRVLEVAGIATVVPTRIFICSESFE